MNTINNFLTGWVPFTCPLVGPYCISAHNHPSNPPATLAIFCVALCYQKLCEGGGILDARFYPKRGNFRLSKSTVRASSGTRVELTISGGCIGVHPIPLFIFGLKLLPVSGSSS
jgi:hypothetical protein